MNKVNEAETNGQASANGQAPATPAKPLDPFDPRRFRIPESELATLGFRKLLTTVRVRKMPDKSWWIRVHPSPDYRLPAAAFLYLASEDDLFLVDPDVVPHVAGDPNFCHRMLVTGVNTQGEVFLWHLRLPNPEGRRDDWQKSAMEGATRAVDSWVRIASSNARKLYEIILPAGGPALNEPQWPDLSFGELLQLGFQDRHITRTDDPVVRRLRGEGQ
jgi:hypothetical protein